MVDEVDETVRAAFADTYQKGYSDGYAAGIVAALEKIQSLATENAVPVPSKEPSMDTPIASLHLRQNYYNVLWRNDIHVIGDIYAFNDPTVGLRDMRGLGYKGICQVRERLIELGYPEIRMPTKW